MLLLDLVRRRLDMVGMGGLLLQVELLLLRERTEKGGVVLVVVWQDLLAHYCARQSETRRTIGIACGAILIIH